MRLVKRKNKYGIRKEKRRQGEREKQAQGQAGAASQPDTRSSESKIYRRKKGKKP